MAGQRTIPLHALLRDAGIQAHAELADPAIHGISVDSRTTGPGMLFVAIPGTAQDGHEFIGDALARGAAAIIAERAPAGTPPVPFVRVDSARLAIALLAAAWYGHPARALRLIGITGTVGKTSVLSMLEAMVVGAGRRAGTIGSLGLRIAGETVEQSSYTVPDPLMLHRQLAAVLDGGCELAAMEVTSHALVQQRVGGLRYDTGVFTNLIPLEHAEFHPNFRAYVAAKARFFDHVAPDAPVIYNADDRAVRRLVRERAAAPIGCGTMRTADVRVRTAATSPEGTRLSLEVRAPLPRMDGERVATGVVPLELRIIGRSNVANAALAATTALVLGVDPAVIRRALAALPPARRRMEVVHRGAILVIDDTVGHPDSVSAVCEAVASLTPRRVHVAWAVRGQRGRRINRYNAEAFAIWAPRLPLGRVVVTRSDDTVDDRNRVTDGEYRAFIGPLERRGVAFESEPTLEHAIGRVLGAAAQGDLVLLLGAQGMDRGRDFARSWLEQNGDDLLSQVQKLQPQQRPHDARTDREEL